MINALRAEISGLSTGRRDLRSFGILVGAALAAVSGFILWKRGLPPTTAAAVTATCSVILLLAAVTSPRLLKPFYLAWMTLAIILGFVMTRVILTIVFFLVVTPIGVIMRLLGKDPLTKGPDESLESYWIPKTYRTRDRDRLRKYY